MRRKIWNRLMVGFGKNWRRILYYAGVAAVLCAAAVCAEQYRTNGKPQAENASVEAAEICAPEPTQAPPALPENAEILREYTAEPKWNEWLSFYETHEGTDVHFDGGKVVSVSDGTVSALEGDSVAIEAGEYVFTYKGIEPAPEIELGTRVQTGDALGIESNTEESWMPPHVHLEARKDGKNVDFMEKLVKNVS